MNTDVPVYDVAADGMMVEIALARSNALKDQGKFDAAIASYNKSLELKPDNPDAHLSYALTMLLMGNYKNGWAGYRWRTKTRVNP